MAGVYIPADIFARFHRALGNDVIMVSGSDVHGTPITVRADEEGVDPQVIVDRYHAEFLDYWDKLDISWDLYTTTGTDNHRQVTWDVFRRLRDHGYIDRQVAQQFFDPEAGRFLPDRYVEGTCPHCGYAQARGDQCDNCGRQLDPEDLIEPRSRISGATPVMRDTEHYFLKLSALQDDLLAWLRTREGWRRHVLNTAIGFTEEGLHDRAITRDLAWGIPIPPSRTTSERASASTSGSRRSSATCRRPRSGRSAPATSRRGGPSGRTRRPSRTTSSARTTSSSTPSSGCAS